MKAAVYKIRKPFLALSDVTISAYLSLCIQSDRIESNKPKNPDAIIDRTKLMSCNQHHLGPYYYVQLNYVVQSGLPIHITTSCCVPQFTSSWILCISTTASRLPAPIRLSSDCSCLPPNKTVRSYEMQGTLSTIRGTGTNDNRTISQEPR